MPKPLNTNPAYRFAAGIIRPTLQAVTKRDWTGHEHIPKTGGFLLCPNHNSYVDVFAVAHFAYDSGRAPYFLGKESVFRIPVAGKIVGAAGMIPVFRESGQAAEAFKAAVQAIEDGKQIVIYPEGTLTRDPDLWPMTGKTGAARIALQTKCPVIPLAQWGPHEIIGRYDKKVRLFPRKTMHLRAGPPVDLSDLYDVPLTSAVLREATDRIMDAITRELEVLRGDTAPAERFDSRTKGVPRIGKYDPGSHASTTSDTPSSETTKGKEQQ